MISLKQKENKKKLRLQSILNEKMEVSKLLQKQITSLEVRQA